MTTVTFISTHHKQGSNSKRILALDLGTVKLEEIGQRNVLLFRL
jgi:hypothetical protein